MDMDFLANFANNNSKEELIYTKEEILKFLKRIGVDTRFVSYYSNGEDSSIKLYIENLRFSKFSKNRTEVFNKNYSDIEVVRSSLFQKICSKSSKMLSYSLNPKDTVLIPNLDNDYNKLLYIVLEPYSRKYGVKFIESSKLSSDSSISINDIDSIISPLNLNQEVNHILNDIFEGRGINWDKKVDDINKIYHVENKNIIFPFINVPEEWINDFLGIKTDYKVDYAREDIGKSFMGFLNEINPQFKENVLSASSFLETHQK